MLKNAARVGDETAPSLGEALRARRKELGLTMQAVADGAGLSVGFISQVERDLTAPSLGSLVSISEVLQTSVSQFLEQPRGTEDLTREAGRRQYAVPGAKPVYERLSTKFEGSQLHSVIVHEPPGRRSEPISHRGEEMFYILDGEITVEIEGKREILCKGDSFHFDSHRVHSTWNHTDRTASLLWCGTMDIFGDAPAPIHKDDPDKGAHINSAGEDTKK
ncbi:cupin domain-containing protein [Ponticoccus sp. SC2-23]|uniref:helix-turn-helix domain-containing protein n=1 Tax=Alexandriicola marinus TaxID=2081710 RepID=UPI000FDC5A43|nr:cupin domain-containing protein [Alexandriicola marinus]MBM1220814.1 cupin domain-containing protein [Ponticoccus sp. SC6-9]MBM1225384.1 cupin domain-containing protein [Ponticoccus sp. SC6-15]MBM1227567.1 cupin domain-containing protein [Ponticoccus sp. SC6-38]MBM1234795.1 cupin domain-containing protein [Ponticoccus sp. SC6-45]MBM1238069.1 cupin domain-containing protein [Ponticoccus sp. SC6-49]MBM1244298.1 cupin domain-containing protein [Ponticoccus sp. SC2-64]MBM1248319.1 cupin domai